MFRESVMVSWIVGVCTGLRNWFVSSGYFRLFSRIADWFGRLYKNSFLYHFFTKPPAAAEGSVVSRMINGIFGLFYRIFHGVADKIRRGAQTSAIASFVRFMFKNWYCISVRSYAVTLFIFTAVRLAIQRLQGTGGLDLITVLFGAVAVIGLFVNVSLAGLYQGCVLKKVIGLPDLKEKMKLQIEVKQHVAVTAAIIVGSLCGLATLLPMWYLLFGGIIGLMIVLSYPKFGAFLLVVFFPFLPTMAVVGLTLLVMLGMFLKYISGDTAKIEVDGFDIAVLAMCGMLLYGILNSYARTAGIPVVMVYLVFVGAFFVIRRCLEDKQFLYNLVDAMIVAAVLVSLYGIYQKISGQADTTWQDTEMFESMGGRVVSTFENPNVLGEYLLITIPLTMARLFFTRQPNRKFAYLVGIVLQVVCMVLTYSRGCWIGLIAAVGIMLVFSGRKITSLCVLALFLVPFVLPDAILERLLSVGNTADSSTSYRVFIWEGTFRMLKDFWYCGIGIGPEAFNSVYPLYALNAIAAPHAHNLYLHVLSEIGVVGLIVVVVLIKNFFTYLVNAVKNFGEMKLLALGTGVGMLGYLIQGMFDNVWYNYRIYFFFFILLALGAAIYDAAKKERAHG